LTGAPLLTRPGGLEGPEGNVPFEVDWVMLGDIFDSGQRFNAPQLKRFAIKLAEGVGTQVWLRPEYGLAFAAPWPWFPDDARQYVYPGYSQPLAIWDLLNAIKPLDKL